MAIHLDASNTSDSHLIRLSRKGDPSAYGMFDERYQSLVCSVAYGRCGDLAMSEDVSQEAFIVAWQKLDDLNEITKFKGWICTIVRNLADRTRKREARGNPRSVALDVVAELPATTASPIERIVSVEQEQLVWEALADVPEDYREPIILFYREEQSVARVAEALELSQDAVKQRLLRGRKMVKEHLAATVEAALRKSKPSKAFTGAVLLGLSVTKVESAIAAGTAGAVATKVASGVGAGGGLSLWYLAPLLKLPLFVWLFNISLDATRSPRERELTLRHQLFWMIGLLLLAIPMFASIPWTNTLEPWLRVLIFSGWVIFMNGFVIISCRRFSKRIERLRIEEKTATPPRPIIAPKAGSQVDLRGSNLVPLFCGSGLLLAIWPAIMSIVTGDGLFTAVFLTLAIVMGLIGSMFCGWFSKHSFQVYAATLGAIVLACIGIMWWRRPVWDGLSSSHFLWFVGTLQALTMNYVVLTIVVWKRVYGKPAEGTDV